MLKKFVTAYILLFSVFANATFPPKHYEIAVPRVQMEAVCKTAALIKEIDIPNNDYKHFVGQINSHADCVFAAENIDEAIHYWLLSGENGSVYGLETAARITFANANDQNGVLMALSLFKLLGAMDKSKRKVYHLYKGMTYLGNRFFAKDIDFATLHFKEAADLGSVEASFLYVHFVETGVIPVENAKVVKSEWIAKAKAIDSEADYSLFMKFAKISDGYVLAN